MVEVVRVNAKVVQDDSRMFAEIPILLDKNKEPVKPLVEFVLKLKRYGMNQSTISNYVQVTQLLLEYMAVNTSGFDSPQSLFENFSSRLYTGRLMMMA